MEVNHPNTEQINISMREESKRDSLESCSGNINSSGDYEDIDSGHGSMDLSQVKKERKART